MSTFDPSTADADCPFCKIASSFPIYDPLHPPSTTPTTPPTTTNSPSSPTSSAPSSPSIQDPTTTSKLPAPPLSLSPSLTTPLTHLLLSTPLCLAFLDIMPLSPGHLLVTTRTHKEKISDVSEEEAAELGRWLPVLSRVLATVGGVWDWNIVQNNGAAAAQVVGHVHFHIIPRPALTDELRNKSFTMFGRGQRTDLDDDEAEELMGKLRVELARELERMEKAKDAMPTQGWGWGSAFERSDDGVWC